MKKIVKTISVILAMTMLIVSILSVNCVAGWQPYLDGSLDEDWDSVPYEEESDPEQILSTVVIDPTVWGDLNADGSITSGDARICLRAAAQLDQLNETQSKAADIFGNGSITAVNARKILRVAAKLDILDCYSLALTVGEQFRIENLVSAGSGRYQWKVHFVDYFGRNEDGEPVGLTLERKDSDTANPGVDGAPVVSEVTVTADHIGQYKLYITNESDSQDPDVRGEVLSAFVMTVYVNPETHMKLNVGESYQLEELWAYSGIPSEWICCVSPQDGLDVSVQERKIEEPMTVESGDILLGLWPVLYQFAFTAKQPGSYQVNIIYKNTFYNEANAVISFMIEVI